MLLAQLLAALASVLAGVPVVALIPAVKVLMRTAVDRFEVQRLLTEGAQLVEVLPTGEYDEEHLVGAIHLPLKQLSPETTAVLDSGRPIIVYCWDAL